MAERTIRGVQEGGRGHLLAAVWKGKNYATERRVFVRKGSGQGNGTTKGGKRNLAKKILTKGHCVVRTFEIKKKKKDNQRT